MLTTSFQVTSTVLTGLTSKLNKIKQSF